MKRFTDIANERWNNGYRMAHVFTQDGNRSSSGSAGADPPTSDRCRSATWERPNGSRPSRGSATLSGSEPQVLARSWGHRGNRRELRLRPVRRHLPRYQPRVAPLREVRPLDAERGVVAVAGVDPGLVGQPVEELGLDVGDQRREPLGSFWVFPTPPGNRQSPVNRCGGAGRGRRRAGRSSPGVWPTRWIARRARRGRPRSCRRRHGLVDRWRRSPSASAAWATEVARRWPRRPRRAPASGRGARAS